MTEKQASRTAVLVCQARAVADGRLGVGRFADPVAVRMLREAERPAVERARGGRPERWRERIGYELLSAVAEVLVSRTVRIDDAMRERGNPQLVILGAGLDARAWRMPELGDAVVFEVDHPASQEDKRSRVAALEAGAGVRFVPVDFGRDKLAAALAEAGHDPARPTTWIWEGVLPYLTEPQVESTLEQLGPVSAPGSRLIATYPSELYGGRLGWLGLRVFSWLSGEQDPMAQERHVSAWSLEDMRDLLARYGFAEASDTDQLTLARELGLEPKRGKSLAMGRVVVADRS
jgi:methyltransferase (TIGR00027 family)